MYKKIIYLVLSLTTFTLSMDLAHAELERCYQNEIKQMRATFEQDGEYTIRTSRSGCSVYFGASVIGSWKVVSRVVSNKPSQGKLLIDGFKSFTYIPNKKTTSDSFTQKVCVSNSGVVTCASTKYNVVIE